MAKNIINQWDPDFLDKSLIFSDLRILLKDTQWSEWPGCQGLLALLDQPVILSSGLQLDMQVQDETLPFPEMAYEERIYKKGIISTREKNWHDLFNAFIWLLFPKTKILLNDLHMQELEQQAGKKRTPCRDAITHIDESGIIIASSDAALLKALKNHQWQEVFSDSRELWFINEGFVNEGLINKEFVSEGLVNNNLVANNLVANNEKTIGAFVFGHGMYEKAFKPFIGFTGKAYCIEVDNNFYQQDKITQYRQLDQLLSNDIKEKKSLSDSGYLSPLPILGIPGWADENRVPDFYDNKSYFRPKRKSQ